MCTPPPTRAHHTDTVIIKEITFKNKFSSYLPGASRNLRRFRFTHPNDSGLRHLAAPEAVRGPEEQGDMWGQCRTSLPLECPCWTSASSAWHCGIWILGLSLIVVTDL